MANMGARVLALFTTLLCVISPASTHDTVCTYIYNQTCIDQVKVVLEDTSLFWFGTQYATDCPQGSTGEPACVNARANDVDSLITRLMQNISADANSINFVVNVTYTLPAQRSYKGCGGRMNVTNEDVTYKKTDPISRHTVRPFDVSTQPSVTWPAESDAIYTVVYVDVGYPILHGLTINVRGGDITLGQVVKSHHGPKNTQSKVNPYAWVVFKQTGNLSADNVTAFLASSAGTFLSFSLSSLMQEFNLQGPLGINIVRSVADEYAASYMRENGAMNLCPKYTQQHINNMVSQLGGLTYNLSYPEASMSIDLMFHGPAKSFCCDDNMARAVNRSVDFMSFPEVTGADTRNLPEVHIVPPSMATTLQGEYFTLIVLDPTPEFNTSTPGSIVHWLVVNIQGKNLTSGDVIIDYWMLNPGPSPKSFLFLLYKQTTGMSQTIKDISAFNGSGCPSLMENRCKFRVATFATTNSLVLTGVREVKVRPDTYSKYRGAMDMGDDDACEDVTGNAKPCPVGGVGAHTGSILCIVGTLLAQLFM